MKELCMCTLCIACRVSAIVTRGIRALMPGVRGVSINCINLFYGRQDCAMRQRALVFTHTSAECRNQVGEFEFQTRPRTMNNSCTDKFARRTGFGSPSATTCLTICLRIFPATDRVVVPKSLFCAPSLQAKLALAV